jgi:hypothetical protein
MTNPGRKSIAGKGDCSVESMKWIKIFVPKGYFGTKIAINYRFLRR